MALDKNVYARSAAASYLGRNDLAWHITPQLEITGCLSHNINITIFGPLRVDTCDLIVTYYTLP